MESGNNYGKRLASYVGRYGKYAVPGLAAMAVISLGRIAQPLILKEIIDKAVPASDTGLLLRYALAYFGIVALIGDSTTPATFSWRSWVSPS